MDHTRLRRRMLDGVFRGDLEDRILEHLGSVRTKQVGPPDLSGMFFGSLCRALATLYLTPPTVWHVDGAEQLEQAIGATGLWASMPRYQSWAIGCREYLMRIDLDDDGLLTYRAVPPDLVLAEAPVDRPDQPTRIAELRQRDDVYTWDIYDISDPAAPIYEVRSAEDAEVPGDGDLIESPGWPDKWRTADGRPVLPWVVHHAEALTDRLWDPYEWITVVEGSLNHSVLCSFWLHVTRDASWPQRYIIDLQVVGLATDGKGADRTAEVTTDPATLLRFASLDDARSPSAGQFQPGGDPATLLTAIGDYAARIGQEAGVSTSDMQRMSGDPRSGYAISLSNEGKRAQQRRFSPSFQASDQRLAALSAVMLNRAHGLGLPESGYTVAYAAIPLSPEELTSRREHALEVYDRKLATRISTYMALNPGETREQAAAELALIDAEQGSDGASARELAETIQKIYLGVGKVVTVDEARAIVSEAGFELPPGVDLQDEPIVGNVTASEDDNA